MHPLPEMGHFAVFMFVFAIVKPLKIQIIITLNLEDT